MSEHQYRRVFACPDGRIAVAVGFDDDTWLMIDERGWMAIAQGEITPDAVELLPPAKVKTMLRVETPATGQPEVVKWHLPEDPS